MMRLYRALMLLIVMLVATACNLGVPTSTPEPIVTASPTVSPTSRPTVTIISPEDGSEYIVNDPVLVSVEARDEVGVTRIQLFANGSVVKVISSESPQGSRELPAVLDYTPRAAGDVALQVIAFRGSVASDPAEITIRVRDRDTGVISTATANPGVPNIPNDGVCRALTNVGLNFRSTPTTTQDNIILVMPSATLAPIIGRLPDNSWWQLSYAGRVGWVSAGFTTVYGNCFSVPVIGFATATPSIPTWTPSPTWTLTPSLTPTASVTPVPPKPDLLVASIAVDDPITIPAGDPDVTVEVAIVVTNNSLGSSGPFRVEMEIDGVNTDLGVFSGLGRGESIFIDAEAVFDTPGTYDIRVFVDTDDEVDEVSEANNTGIVTVTVVAGS